MNNDDDYRRNIKYTFLSSAGTYDAYFQFYDALFSRACGDIEARQLEARDPANVDGTIKHEDILSAGRILQNSSQITFKEALMRLPSKIIGDPSLDKLKFTLLIAAHAMIMLDPAPGGYQIGGWLHDQQFADFVCKRLPRTTVDESLATWEKVTFDINVLKAWKLESRCGISFRPTDDISRHLYLDSRHSRKATVYLFHHTSFLRAHLQRLKARGKSFEDDMADCLQSGCLSPRLCVETLHSLQDVLFKYHDERSRRILSRLIDKEGFDEDCARAEGYTLLDDPRGLKYQYWGQRLMELQQFALSRPPKNSFERWMKWQTSESNAFAVALVALFISIFVGILTLGLSGFQAWVAWKAWKEPAQGGDEVSVRLKDLLDWARQQGR